MENQTKLFNFRLSIELMDAVKAKAGKTSMTDVITVALGNYVTGGSMVVLADAPAADMQAIMRINNELEAKVASLTGLVEAQRVMRLKAEADRDQWRDRAKAIVSVTSNAEGRRLARGHDPMGRSPHQSGPLLASAVPEGLTETVKPFFRPGTNAAKPSRGR